MTGSGPTIFEVVRRVDELASKLDEQASGTAARFERVAERLDAAVLRLEGKYVSREVHDALVDRVRKIEDRSEWLVRIVGALVIGAIFAIVVATGNGPRGS